MPALFKRGLLLFLGISLLLGCWYGRANALPSEDIKVQINDRLVSFPDAQPMLDSQEKLQVPLRFVTDALGMELAWSMKIPGQVSATLKQGGTSIQLTTGMREASINGGGSLLDSPPLFRDGRVYVPLRFIAETLHLRIQWDNPDRIAILDQDGRYHAPAWYAPKSPAPMEVTATAYSDSPAENGKWGGHDYSGDSLELGTIAVDPSVIPLGTRVRIMGYASNDLPADGLLAVAADTGSAIKGNRIDIYIPGPRQKALDFGVQQVKLIFLPPQD